METTKLIAVSQNFSWKIWNYQKFSDCARDVKYFSEAGKTQSLKCEPNGNYKSYQKTSNKGYCVDKYGFRKSPSNVDVQDETSCDQYRAY